jgi:hypothetical protein
MLEQIRNHCAFVIVATHLHSHSAAYVFCWIFRLETVSMKELIELFSGVSRMTLMRFDHVMTQIT